jgi:hypothetical protein
MAAKKLRAVSFFKMRLPYPDRHLKRVGRGLLIPLIQIKAQTDMICWFAKP